MQLLQMSQYKSTLNSLPLIVVLGSGVLKLRLPARESQLLNIARYINSPLIILLQSPVIYSFEVIYVCCICMVIIQQHLVISYISSQFHNQEFHVRHIVGLFLCQLANATNGDYFPLGELVVKHLLTHHQLQVTPSIRCA